MYRCNGAPVVKPALKFIDLPLYVAVCFFALKLQADRNDLLHVLVVLSVFDNLRSIEANLSVRLISHLPDYLMHIEYS